MLCLAIALFPMCPIWVWGFGKFFLVRLLFFGKLRLSGPEGLWFRLLFWFGAWICKNRARVGWAVCDFQHSANIHGMGTYGRL